MDSNLLGALVAVGGMLLVCAVEEVRLRRRITKRQRIFIAADVRSKAQRAQGGAR